jgi:membrane protein YqaA with SNARE-associated domain
MVVVMVPFGTDALVIVLATRYGELFWIFPPLVTAGSLAAAALTYWVGYRAGFAGLPRLVAQHHLERVRSRLGSTSTGALALAAVLPAPFPLTAFVLICGAIANEWFRIDCQPRLALCAKHVTCVEISHQQHIVFRRQR